MRTDSLGGNARTVMVANIVSFFVFVFVFLILFRSLSSLIQSNHSQRSPDNFVTSFRVQQVIILRKRSQHLGMLF